LVNIIKFYKMHGTHCTKITDFSFFILKWLSQTVYTTNDEQTGVYLCDTNISVFLHKRFENITRPVNILCSKPPVICLGILIFLIVSSNVVSILLGWDGLGFVSNL